MKSTNTGFMITIWKNSVNGEVEAKNYCFKKMNRYFTQEFLSSLHSISANSIGSSTFLAQKNSIFSNFSRIIFYLQLVTASATLNLALITENMIFRWNKLFVMIMRIRFAIKLIISNLKWCRHGI